MKIAKPKTTPVKRISKRTTSTSNVVKLTRANIPVVRSFRLIEHKHTGKLIHHRHTSHLSLAIMLLLVGVFIYISAGFARVRAEEVSGSVSISMVVPGAAPTVGATIIGPISGVTLTDKDVIEVTGSCTPGTFVVLKNNNQLVGSGVCTAAGIFSIQIQLQTGENVLSALNYDNLNQPGPSTPLVTVILQKTVADPVALMPVIAPILPNNPSVIPGLDPAEPGCDEQKAQAITEGGLPQVAVSCVPRFIQANKQYSLSVITWGGAAPYALDINWGGDKNDTLLSVPVPGATTVKFSYAKAGVYIIKFELKDKDGHSATVQSSVQANGGGSTPLTILENEIFHTSWLKTPVPLYLTSVALTLGFWGGDLFDRNFGARKPRHSQKRAI